MQEIEREYKWRVEVKPYGSPRPRLNSKAEEGESKAYMPAAYKKWKQRFRTFSVNLPDCYYSDPVRVDVIVSMKLPKRTSKKSRSELLGTACTKKPDFDNVLKSVVDAIFPEKLSQYDRLHRGDNHVYGGSLLKVHGDVDCIYVTVTLIDVEAEREDFALLNAQFESRAVW